MIINFFFDNRIGGPHINIFRISNNFKKKKILHVTVGKSNFTKFNLTNLRFFNKLLYPIEIIINIFQIILHFRKYNCVFLSNSIFNVAPIIAGSLMRKRTFWYLLEEPNFFSKIIFIISKKLFKFEVLSISKKICKTLNIKKYRYFPPYINKKKFISKKLNKKNLKIVSIGNVNKVKNHFFAIQCLKKFNSNFEYDIIGAKINTQKNLYSSLEKFIKRKKLDKKIKLRGFKKQKEIERILKKKDIFLLPSITEGCPVSLLEALSQGKICICSKVGDIPMIIKNNFNGFLFDLTEESLLSVLNKIKKMNYKNLNKIQLEAVRTINTKFSNLNYYRAIFS